MADTKQLLVNILTSSSNDEVTRDELIRRLESLDVKTSDAIKVLKLADPSAYVKRNPIVFDRQKLLLRFSADSIARPVVAEAAFTHQTKSTGEIQFSSGVIDATLDPTLTKFYPTRSYKHLKRRLNPNFPLNIFVWGETGVGKSTSVIHIAKEQGRKVVRTNLSKFADVDDLFGGIRISEGTTFFDKGPALVAMEMGAVLILDECDSADPQLLTDLHPILEKSGYLIKKLKKMIYPTPGFCVVATANTNGRGDMTGKYVGTSVLNRAFLDRFATGIEYLSPTKTELKRIIEVSLSDSPEAVVRGIVDWYEQIDTAVVNGAIDDRVSPRKILDIVELMMSDGVVDIADPKAKECIVEATNLLDSHISKAMAELWDAMIHSRSS